MVSQHHRYAAFSLVELSIIVTVIALALVGYLSTYDTGSSTGTVLAYPKKQALTYDRMDAIRRALSEFATENSYYPCPSDPTDNIADANFGTGAQGADCATNVTGGGNLHYDATNDIYGGMVPVETLDLPIEYAFDGWGGQFFYMVHEDSANAVDGAGTITVLHNFDDSVAAASQITNFEEITTAEYALISFGADGGGAYSYVTTGSASRKSIAEANDSIQQTVNHFSYNHTGTAADDSTFDHIVLRGAGDSLGTLIFDDIVCWGISTADSC